MPLGPVAHKVLHPLIDAQLKRIHVACHSGTLDIATIDDALAQLQEIIALEQQADAGGENATSQVPNPPATPT